MDDPLLPEQLQACEQVFCKALHLRDAEALELVLLHHCVQIFSGGNEIDRLTLPFDHRVHRFFSYDKKCSMNSIGADFLLSVAYSPAASSKTKSMNLKRKRDYFLNSPQEFKGDAEMVAEVKVLLHMEDVGLVLLVFLPQRI